MDRNDSKSHDQSLSLDHVSVVPLVQTRAKARIEIIANQFAIEHMPLLLPFVSRRECFAKLNSLLVAKSVEYISYHYCVS